MNSRAAITVNRPRDDVERQWRTHEPEHAKDDPGETTARGDQRGCMRYRDCKREAGVGGDAALGGYKAFRHGGWDGAETQKHRH